MNKLITAINFAAKSVAETTRTTIKIVDDSSVGKSSIITSVSIPYINYLIELLAIVSNSDADVNVMCATVLHESLTDKSATIEQLTEQFGTDVAKIVEFYSKFGNESFPISQNENISNKSIWAAVNLIKTSVKLSMFGKSSTTENPIGWTREEIDEYFRWNMWPELNDYNKIVKAVTFAAFAHKDQRRKNAQKTPYINHPIEVMYFLSSSGVTDVDTLCAAVLHDTVEDVGVTEEQLVKFFGATVAKIVMECSDNKSLPKEVRKQEQINHAKLASHGAKLVKSADKLSNISDLNATPPVGWTEKGIEYYFSWSYAVWLETRGHNELLDQKLSEEFAKRGLLDISTEELTNRLSEYYDYLRSM